MGLESCGFETVWANDFDKKAFLTYNKNFDAPAVDIRDLTKIDANEIPEFNVLTGGFPCQPFSRAGLEKGFEDTRGTLFFNIADIIQTHKPHSFLLENVKGLLGHDKGHTFRVILRTLENLGYTVHYQVLNSKTHANVPHNRERLFIVGFLADRGFKFPEPIPLTTSIFDLLDTDVDDKYYLSDSLMEKVSEEITDCNHVYQWRYGYVRKHMTPGVSPCLLTGGTNSIVMDKKGVRYITPREAFRLQGFPDSYQFADVPDRSLYKHAGNSVTVPLIQRIGEQMWKVLS